MATLVQQRDTLQATADIYAESLYDLKLYLMSAKFREDPNVNTGDILLRLHEITQRVIEL
jgi:hypothetical protein